jgi:predicted permease
VRLLRLLSTLPLRIRSLFRRNQVEQELDDEFRDHVERRIEADIAKGMSADDARYAAMRAMGGLEQRKEECRDMRGTQLIDQFLQDIRYAWRSLVQSPGFFAITLVSLALGIGANTAIFSIVDHVLFRRLPLPQPDRLYSLQRVTPDGASGSFPYPAFAQFRARSSGLPGVVGFAHRQARLDVGGQRVEGVVQLASDGYFSILDVKPALGRTFTIGTNASEPEAVLSDRASRRWFGSAPLAAGQNLTLNGTNFTVVGVMPRGFTGVSLDYDVDVWLPITAQPRVEADSLLASSGINWVELLVRLQPDVSEQEAAAAAKVVYARYLHSVEGTGTPRQTLQLVSAARPVSGARDAASQPLLILMALVGLVLLIACANIANLLLARAAARAREFTVRAALGAGRARLTRQLLTESLLLSLLGGAAGLLVAYFATALLVDQLSRGAFLNAGIPAALAFTPDLRVLTFTLALSIGVGILFGMRPAVAATKVDLTSALRSHNGAPHAGRRTLRRILVMSQLAVSFLLLVTAGLLIHSFQNVATADLGYDPENVVQLELRAPQQGHTEVQLRELSARVLAALEATPGVEAASLSVPGLLQRGTFQTSLQPEPQGGVFRVHGCAVTPGFFSTNRIALRNGRSFTARDNADASKVVVLSETAARSLFPNQDPTGKHVRLYGSPAAVEIIGVASDIKLHSVLETPLVSAYVPLEQMPTAAQIARSSAFQVRVTGSAAAMLPVLRRVVGSVDQSLGVEVQLLNARVEQSALLPKVAAWVTGLFGFLGLLLMSIGVYGLLSYLVVQRTAEIGIRVALGARRGEVLWMVWRELMGPVATGVGLGLAAALASTRVLGGFLFGLTATDPWTLVAATAALVAVATLAGLVPARRAARVDPIEALRHE